MVEPEDLPQPLLPPQQGLAGDDGVWTHLPLSKHLASLVNRSLLHTRLFCSAMFGPMHSNELLGVQWWSAQWDNFVGVNVAHACQGRTHDPRVAVIVHVCPETHTVVYYTERRHWNLEQALRPSWQMERACDSQSHRCSRLEKGVLRSQALMSQGWTIRSEI
eukprot:6484332-Amphidinium_carterae.1